MSTLTIKDLAIAEVLDAGKMAEVRGGMAQDMMPAAWGQMMELEKGFFSFDPKQFLKQGQNSVVNNGNNAAFVNSIDPSSPDQAITNRVSF